MSATRVDLDVFEQARQVIDKRREALGQANPDGMAALYADGATFDIDGKIYEGKAEIASMLRSKVGGAMSRVFAEWEERPVDALTYFYAGRSRLNGHTQVESMDEFEVRDGQIQRHVSRTFKRQKVPGAETIIAAVRDALPAFAECAATIDEVRAYPEANMARLRELRIPAMSVPRHLGGLGFGATEQAEVLKLAASADGSTALALAMHCVAVELLMNVPGLDAKDEILRGVCEESHMLCSIISTPTSELDVTRNPLTARREGDNYIVSGAGGFATNSEGSRNVFVFCKLEGKSGVLCAVLDTRSPHIKNLHNWSGMGMRGSSSHDVIVEDAVVSAKWCTHIPDRGSVISEDLPGRLVPWAHMGIWIGLGEAALSFTRDYLIGRKGMIPGLAPNFQGFEPEQQRSAEPWAQTAVGRMAYRLWSAETLLNDWLAKVDSGEARDKSVIMINRMRLTIALREMIENLFIDALKVCGAHAYVGIRPLERLFRDALAGVAMKAKSDQILQNIGAIILDTSQPIPPK